MESNLNFDVVIVGAGAAGIACAKYFSEKNISYIVLEAQEQTGGRCITIDVITSGVDHGASWIHYFQNKSNPFLKIIADYQIKLVEVDKERMECIDPDTGVISEELMEKSEDIIEKLLAKFEKKVKKLKEDCSIQEVLQEQIDKYQKMSNITLKRLVNYMINEFEHYEAASLSELSALNGLGKDDEDDFHIQDHELKDNKLPVGGYGTLLQLLSKNLNIKTNQIVEQIQYDQSFVRITTQDKTYTSKKIVVTVPLSVLQRNLIKFEPELPKKKQDAIQKLGFGLMNKIILEFKESFWSQEIEWYVLCSDTWGKYPMFQNLQRVNGSNKLLCFVTDNFARQSVELKSDSEIITEILEFLQVYFKKCQDLKSNLVNYQITRWGQKQHIWGSYSFFKVGSSIKSQKDLAKDVNETVFFAGEACSVEFMGTVAGAYLEGLKCALAIDNLKL